MSFRNLMKMLTGGSEFNLPLLSDAYEIGEDEFLEIGMDGEDLTYHVSYPSGLTREFKDYVGLHRELTRFITNNEHREEVIRYATNWRRTVFFPSIMQQFVRLPDGRINFGGMGNSSLHLHPRLMRLHMKYNVNGGSE